MGDVKTDALVLRYSNYGEYDRMLTLLSPELGKLSVSARGCRRGHSRVMNATELFCAGEYMLRQHQDRYTLASALIKDSYYDLRCDYDRLTEGVEWLRLCETVAQPAQEQRLLFALMLKGLAYLCYSHIGLQMVSLAFYTHLADVSGFAPELGHCVRCGGELAEPMWLDIAGGGLVCDQCGGASAAPRLSMRALEVLRGFKTVRFAQLSGIQADNLALATAAQLMKTYLNAHLER